MMETRLSRWGVGPRIFVPSLLYTIVAWLGTSRWPGAFRLDILPDICRIIGAILIAVGVLIWLAGVVTVMRAYNRDQLVTSGVFALVRHPVYAGWITLVFPGLALLTRSWPMCFTPLIAYLIFRSLISCEDEYLRKRFGRAYLDYARRVNEIVPIPRFWQSGR